MAENDVPSHLLAVYKLHDSMPDLKKKAKDSLKSILQMCTHLEALEPLISVIYPFRLTILKESPPDILEYILIQFVKTLPKDNAAKKYKPPSISLTLKVICSH